MSLENWNYDIILEALYYYRANKQEVVKNFIRNKKMFENEEFNIIMDVKKQKTYEIDKTIQLIHQEIYNKKRKEIK